MKHIQELKLNEAKKSSKPVKSDLQEEMEVICHPHHISQILSSATEDELNSIKKVLFPIYNKIVRRGSENLEWTFNFTSGGWNSIFAKTKKEAIEKAEEKYYNEPKLTVDPKTFRLSTPSETNQLMSNFD